ncbi:MAG: Rrf2 family transcriptional regulator [Paraburkholderia sp.]|uniref:RrF2 family transcriptional regulator n=1 Tax=Paraburkholderia sp. TaxID=1926495 RepID=UPI003C4775F8
MAHISTGVEYGLHCLLYLSEPGAGAREASAKDLAELQGVPVEYVAKLFTKLSRAGIVAATEGVRGGFRLARPAANISVLDIVNAIDGEKALFDCREIRGNCAVFDDKPPAWATRGVCSIHAVMLDAEKRMNEALAAHSLVDLATRTAEKAPAAFGHQVVKWLAHRSANRRGDSGSSN